MTADGVSITHPSDVYTSRRPVTASSRIPQRRTILVQGTVQGVGFRPHIYRLASFYGLAGFVKNQMNGVCIEAEGAEWALDRFTDTLATDLLPSAQIDHLESKPAAPQGDVTFRIVESESGSAPGPVAMSPDLACCAMCAQEIGDPGNRRYGYAFTSCTQCGPRLTIAESLPYDRVRTTMTAFTMCVHCRREYEDPASRRFHAQSNACADCGPSLALIAASGSAPVGNPLISAVDALRAGKIIAMKGLGGYHLVCDATNDRAVATLRQRKHRDEKPFAIMVADLTAVDSLCHVSSEERELLASPAHPIVLLRRRPRAAVCDTVAPSSSLLGVLIPYTPLHELLLRAMAPTPLVMTSGNRSDEPIAFDDAAVEQLVDIADVFLTHNRTIRLRCDDSVARVVGGVPTLLRRSRGYVPNWLPLPSTCSRPMLALGGHMKVTFAFGHDDRAILSHHIGDLDDQRAYETFVESIAHYEKLFAMAPQVLVHDLHPEYSSTRYACDRAASEGLELLGVQHHHAHVASVLAEHGLAEDVIGVAFDGTGFGADGTIWGGEFLVGDLRSVRRAAHLRYVSLPGGERAIREPWRMLVSHMHDAGAGDSIADVLARRIQPAALRTVRQMIERGVQSPACSSIGRLFDAIAALVVRRDFTSFEGQAAMELEELAERGPRDAGPYPFDIEPGQSLVIDTRPTIRAALSDCQRNVDGAVIARRFHDTVAAIIVTVCNCVRDTTGLNVVVLSGGVLQNAILAVQASEELSAAGFRVYRNLQVPPGDGGLALGQLAIAAAHTSAGPR
jgi:hydrogenase maturation protein HypF